MAEKPKRKERPGKKFTAIGIGNLKPETERYEIRDLNAEGLYVAVSPSGHKGFVVRYRFKGEPRKLSLGNIPLSKARVAAAAAFDEVKEGRDPSVAKQTAKAGKRVVEANTFKVVAEQYLKIVCGMKRAGDDAKPTFNGVIRSAPQQSANLERLVFPQIGDRPISEIKRSEIVALLDKIAAGELKDADGEVIKGGPVMADRTLALIRRIMNWHAARADDFRSPFVRGMARTKAKERARARTLTDDEIRAIWKAATEGKGPFPALVRVLLLTGARRTEASAMTRDEISDDGDWLLPQIRNKAKFDLTRPLSEAARAVIESQLRDGCPYVFSTDGKTPISAFSKFKKRFDEASGTSDWTLHDLRRTARSLMSRAGVDSDHAERALGHVVAGVRGVYDRHDFRTEMKIAYDKLAALIEQIANPPEGGKVILLLPTKKRDGR
jgi:integrase